MSFKYTTTNELVNGHKMSSISLMKVARTFVNLKGICCAWSMIVQRSLFQPDVYPRKFVHPSTRGGCGGDLSPSRGSGGADPPRLGGLGASGPPKLKIDVNLPCKSIVISSQSEPFIRRMI